MGGLLVVIAYLGAVYGPLSAIAHTTGALQQARVSARRVQEMFALTPEALDVEDAIDASGIVGDVVFEDVNFAYDESRQILRGHQLRRQPRRDGRARRPHRRRQDHHRQPDPAVLRSDRSAA